MSKTKARKNSVGATLPRMTNKGWCVVLLGEDHCASQWVMTEKEEMDVLSKISPIPQGMGEIGGGEEGGYALESRLYCFEGLCANLPPSWKKREGVNARLAAEEAHEARGAELEREVLDKDASIGVTKIKQRI